MKDENALQGELKDIYNRVMSTKPEKKVDTKVTPATPNITQTKPAGSTLEKKPEPVPEPPKKEETHPSPAPTTQAPVVATTFAYSAKNPLKPKTPEKPKIPEAKKPQDTTKEATKVAAKSSRMPLIAGGMITFAIIWGVIWALMLGLL